MSGSAQRRRRIHYPFRPMRAWTCGPLVAGIVLFNFAEPVRGKERSVAGRSTDISTPEYKGFVVRLPDADLLFKVFDKSISDEAYLKAKEQVPSAAEAIYQCLDGKDTDGYVYKVNNAEVLSWTVIPPPLSQAFQYADSVRGLTYGAFDVTIRPLYELYTFDGQEHELPPLELVDQRRKLIGPLVYSYDATNSRCRRNLDGVALDFRPLREGMIVDECVNIARRLGLTGVSVGYGGEAGCIARRTGEGFEMPTASPGISLLVKTGNISMSADVPFFTSNGRRFSHLFDARTGRPIDTGVKAVAVFANQCWIADGLATALGALGVEEGMKLIEGLSGIDAIMWYEPTPGKVRGVCSSGITRVAPGKFAWSPGVP